jgi:hypothetical protein
MFGRRHHRERSFRQAPSLLLIFAALLLLGALPSAADIGVGPGGGTPGTS